MHICTFNIQQPKQTNTNAAINVIYFHFLFTSESGSWGALESIPAVKNRNKPWPGHRAHYSLAPGGNFALPNVPTHARGEQIHKKSQNKIRGPGTNIHTTNFI